MKINVKEKAPLRIEHKHTVLIVVLIIILISLAIKVWG